MGCSWCFLGASWVAPGASCGAPGRHRTLLHRSRTLQLLLLRPQTAPATRLMCQTTVQRAYGPVSVSRHSDVPAQSIVGRNCDRNCDRNMQDRRTYSASSATPPQYCGGSTLVYIYIYISMCVCVLFVSPFFMFLYFRIFI